MRTLPIPAAPMRPSRDLGAWRRTPTGHFVFETVKPGPVGNGHAPHITLIIFARGGQNHLYTRIYFADEAVANASDPVLVSVPADRRDTLIATRSSGGYRFDIRIQGDRETVFFDV